MTAHPDPTAADPTAIRDAIATVRNPPVEFVLSQSDELVSVVNERALNVARAVIVGHFLAMRDAGELVRAVHCPKCGGGGGTKCYRCGGNDAVNCRLRVGPQCETCQGEGYTLEPIIPTETAS